MAIKNGKLLVRLDERVQTHTETINELKIGQKEVKDILDDIKNILNTGEGKIKRNFMLIEEHRKETERNDRKLIAWITIIVALVSVIVNVAFRV